jgi:voltage-gated potassium channel
MYFAFTTLSTVGFGDFYPISNNERVVGAIVLFVGVLIFSYIIGSLIQKFNSFVKLHEGFDEGYEL